MPTNNPSSPKTADQQACAHLHLIHDGNASNPHKCTDCGMELFLTFLGNYPSVPKPAETGNEADLESLFKTIRAWIVTESGPTRMKFSHPKLQVQVTIMGYKKIILERKFADGK